MGFVGEELPGCIHLPRNFRMSSALFPVSSAWFVGLGPGYLKTLHRASSSSAKRNFSLDGERPTQPMPAGSNRTTTRMLLNMTWLLWRFLLIFPIRIPALGWQWAKDAQTPEAQVANPPPPRAKGPGAPPFRPSSP